MKKKKKKKSQNDKVDITPLQIYIANIKMKLDTYFKVIVKNIRDVAPKIIGFNMLKILQQNIETDLFALVARNERIHTLLIEPAHVAEERRTLNKTYDILKKSFTMLTKDADLVITNNNEDDQLVMELQKYQKYEKQEKQVKQEKPEKPRLASPIQEKSINQTYLKENPAKPSSNDSFQNSQNLQNLQNFQNAQKNPKSDSPPMKEEEKRIQNKQDSYSLGTNLRNDYQSNPLNLNSNQQVASSAKIVEDNKAQKMTSAISSAQNPSPSNKDDSTKKQQSIFPEKPLLQKTEENPLKAQNVIPSNIPSSNPNQNTTVSQPPMNKEKKTNLFGNKSNLFGTKKN